MPRNYKPNPPKPIEIASPEGSECWEVTSHTWKAEGYPMLKLDGRASRMSRYIYRFFHGDIPEGHVVRHTCDNPRCVNPNHLISGTHADNVQDRVARGRSASGQRNGRSKLTEAQVLQACASDESSWELAKRFKCDHRAIDFIRDGTNYSWLTGRQKKERKPRACVNTDDLS